MVESLPRDVDVDGAEGDEPLLLLPATETMGTVLLPPLTAATTWPFVIDLWLTFRFLVQ